MDYVITDQCDDDAPHLCTRVLRAGVALDHGVWCCVLCLITNNKLLKLWTARSHGNHYLCFTHILYPAQEQTYFYLIITNSVQGN